MQKLDKLRDIKDIIAVEDYSLYILIAIIFFTIFLIIVVTYFLKKERIKPRLSQKELAYKRIKQLDLVNNDVKTIVYTISIDGKLFLDENNKKLYENIQKRTIEYKYKKDINKLDKSTIDLIKQFINSIKVGKKDDK